MAAAFHSICQDLEQTIASAELSMYKWPTRQLYIIFRMADFHYNCCLFQVMDDNVAMAAELDVQQQRMDGLVSEMEGKSKAAVEQQKAALHAVNAKHESEVREEAPVSITFGQHVSNRFKVIYSKSSCQELSIDNVWVESKGGGMGGSEFFEPPCAPPPKIYWATPTKFKYISGILSSSPVDWHPFFLAN
jgi:hypothetical protein